MGVLMTNRPFSWSQGKGEGAGTMKPWVKTLRRASGLVEHVCEHGVGHPAAASVNWAQLNGHECMDVHGCCGCCQSPEWKLADATEGYKKANELLLEALKRKEES